MSLYSFHILSLHEYYMKHSRYSASVRHRGQIAYMGTCENKEGRS